MFVRPPFQFLINGCLASFFIAFGGLQQGDPLSPFLFIITSEVLSRMISKVEMGYISGFSVGAREVTIFHLQFADDTIIFYDADLRQLRYFRCILRCFVAVSMLKIN